MRLNWAALTALPILGMSAEAAEMNPEMRGWVGKYPGSAYEVTPYATTVNFFGDPEVKEGIKNVLGPEAIPQMKNMNTVGPIEEQRGWLIAYGCQPHMCSDGDWLVAINLSNLETRACLARSGSRTVRFGASGKGYVDLSRATTGLALPCPTAEEALAVFERVFPQTPSQTVVTLRKEGGTFVVPVEINGAITLDFTVDSGADHISVPLDVYSTLRRKGTIKDSDVIGEQTYTSWDGSKSQSFTCISGNSI